MNITEEQSNNISKNMQYAFHYHVPEVLIKIKIDPGDDILRKYYQTFTYKNNTFSFAISRESLFIYNILFNILYIVERLGEYVGYPDE